MVELAGLVKDGKLVSSNEWYSYIDSLKNEVKSEISDEKKAIEAIKHHFLLAIKKRYPSKKFGIFFSGGVDSTGISFISKKDKQDFICYTVGLEGSEDIEYSVRIAKEYGFNHKKKILTMDEVEEIFESLAKIIPKKDLNVVNLGVGAVELAAIELAKKDKIDTLFGGLGSEEIFAGYQRHEKSKDINEECWNGLKTTYDRDFGRDYSIAVAEGMTFLTPFLDKDLIIAAMQVSGKLKLKDEHKKYIFRKLMIDLGLKEEYAYRPKKAAQYGSSFDKAILKIAKSKSFSHKHKYIEYLKNI